MIQRGQQADTVCSVEPRSRETVDVIEFQVASLGAPVAMLVGQRAAPAHDWSLLVGGSLASLLR
jgi:hypothetical protein